MADIDFGQLSEALNDKSDRDLRNVDTTAKADAVIDFQLPTAENNYTWYRKYKSGWVEQGGISNASTNSTNSPATITLLIEMSDTNYFVSVTKRTPDTASGSYYYGVRVKKATLTTTSFDVLADSTGGFAWEVKGIAAN